MNRVETRSIFQSPRFWFGLALVVLVGVSCVRVASDESFKALPKSTSDGPIYENLAYHLSVGHGFRIDLQEPQWRELYEQSDATAYATYLDAPPQSMPMTGRPPLFPVLIAVAYKAVGRGEGAFACVRIFLALCIAVACCLAIGNSAALMIRPDSAGRKLSSWSISCGCCVAILLAASNRTLHSYAGDFLTEPLALLLTQIFVAALLTIAVAKTSAGGPALSRWFTVWIAFVFAAMILARSLFVLWIPGVGLLVAVLLRAFPERCWRSAGIFLMLTVVFLSPWWIRNCTVLGRIMPLGTQGPITMLGGYCDEALAAGGDWQYVPEQRLRAALSSDPEFQQLPNDVERELMVAEVAKRQVRAWIAEHLTDLPRLFAQRVVTHWNPYTGKSLIWRLLILVGAVYLLIKRRPEAWVLVGLPLMNTVLVASLYTTGGRFLVPLYGILFTLSAIGTAVLVESLLKLPRRFERAEKHASKPT